jgi:hypothetical protein
MIFDAGPDHIATLDSLQLVKLMKRLLLAEARLTGIPLRAASVPLQVTVPDGGEDGSIRWTGRADSTPYIRQAEIMMRIASEFGFTPASRSRLSAPATEQPTLFDFDDESMA